MADPVRRAALISDVHGNVPALAATLEEVAASDVDVVMFLGCLTWGPEPLRVLEMARSLPQPTFFVRGNGERAVIELADGSRAPERPADTWMVAAHASDGVDTLRSFASEVVLEVAGLGSVRACHGSPRSDIELLTPGTPEARLRQAFAGAPEDVVTHGHTHVQYERRAIGRRVVGPGSVGLPYGVVPGRACWAILGPDVELRVTPYDLGLAEEAARAAGFPALERYLQMLLEPPTLGQIEADAEQREFSD
ncbi:MAG TPA: metallophosphoesterase family protein [Candidatus Dormibacteraeota bacterium]|jgi:diadenosine tetraphosphatase ApaH/serine/threonine PP2A family protein phosphatase|nr:metallophosphoesterase family protein [Candidatus Dormibacteraeota bacterium]